MSAEEAITPDESQGAGESPPGQAAERLGSAKSLADVARAGLRMLAGPTTMQVHFEVHHIADRPGYLGALLSTDAAAVARSPAIAEHQGHETLRIADRTNDDQSDHASMFQGGAELYLETLSSAANGVGFVVGTRTRPLESPTLSVDGSEATAIRVRTDSKGRSRVFTGTARPNPIFIYESAHVFEGIIGIDRAARSVTNRHARDIREVMYMLASLAASSDVKAPILSLQSPAQLWPRSHTDVHDIRTVSEINPPQPSSIAVRFAIALGTDRLSTKLPVADHIQQYCVAHGFSLAFTDSRPGHRSGNWYQVVGPKSDVDSNDSFDFANDFPGSILPVTFIGPARVGSTHAILSYLRRYSEVGIAGCSITSLDDLAFIHVQLALRGVNAPRLNRAIREYFVGRRPEDRPIQEPIMLLANVLSGLGWERGFGSTTKDEEVTKRARDYQTLVGPAFDSGLLLRRTQPGERTALWISWQVLRTDNGLSRTLAGLYEALDDVARDIRYGGAGGLSTVANIEYLVCRATDGRRLRGRGKVSVPSEVLDHVPPSDIESSASALCGMIETGWKLRLDTGPVLGVGELTVAWREPWLGHWTYV